MLDVLGESEVANNVEKQGNWKEIHVERRLCAVMMSWSSTLISLDSLDF